MKTKATQCSVYRCCLLLVLYINASKKFHIKWVWVQNFSLLAGSQSLRSIISSYRISSPPCNRICKHRLKSCKTRSSYYRCIYIIRSCKINFWVSQYNGVKSHNTPPSIFTSEPALSCIEITCVYFTYG